MTAFLYGFFGRYSLLLCIKKQFMSVSSNMPFDTIVTNRIYFRQTSKCFLLLLLSLPLLHFTPCVDYIDRHFLLLVGYGDEKYESDHVWWCGQKIIFVQKYWECEDKYWAIICSMRMQWEDWQNIAQHFFSLSGAIFCVVWGVWEHSILSLKNELNTFAQNIDRNCCQPLL